MAGFLSANTFGTESLLMKGKLALMREETDLRDDASITAVRLSTTKNISIFQSRMAVRDSVPMPPIPHFLHHAAH